jgi:hypothetical protein
MISFLLEEGVLTVGTLSGLFTTALLNSLKRNIIDPSIERLLPSHKLDKQESFADLFPIPTGSDGNKPHQPDGVNLTGQNSSELILTDPMVGKKITVVASYTDGQGFAESKTSAEFGPITNLNQSPVGTVTIASSDNKLFHCNAIIQCMFGIEQKRE